MVISNPNTAIPLQTDSYGVVRVSGTRVTLDTIIGFYKQGETAEQLAESFDTVPLADIHAVISYYLNHQAEVEAYLTEGERRRDELKREIQSRLPTNGLREKLLARKAQRGL